MNEWKFFYKLQYLYKGKESKFYQWTQHSSGYKPLNLLTAAEPFFFFFSFPVLTTYAWKIK